MRNVMKPIWITIKMIKLLDHLLRKAAIVKSVEKLILGQLSNVQFQKKLNLSYLAITMKFHIHTNESSMFGGLI